MEATSTTDNYNWSPNVPTIQSQKALVQTLMKMMID